MAQFQEAAVSRLCFCHSMNERRRTTVTDPLLDQQMEFSVVPCPVCAARVG